ncbi:MAG: accessory Sec system translocase SecA2 [Deltaproteobacteria bacterium]|nr:accessory Sec system translocase SecA2 [Deltaproteobacteria bacterium]
MENLNVDAWTRVRRGVDRLRGRPLEYDLRPYHDVLKRIDRKAEDLRLETADDQLIGQRAEQLRYLAQTGVALTELLVEAFALGREASHRTLGLRHFDVQMVAGIALFDGRLVEMQTGEGKTLAAVLPAFLSALDGRGVHVLTFNDYLAKRDADWMRPIYERLGLSVGFVAEGMTAAERRSAYAKDVTYLTAKEAGYDLLRDSIAEDSDDLILRPYNCAIVDEADSILIDEARVPLVIAGSDETKEDAERARLAALVEGLEAGEDYLTDENDRNVFLSERGVVKMQRLLGCRDLHQSTNRDLLTLINQALHAAALLKRDVDYLVRDGQVEIIDELTGRVVPDRHWPDGLHRAVEAKEGLRQKSDGYILNSITMQHFLRLYPRLSGMTGTAVSAERECDEFYGLKTVVIPPNRPNIRLDHPDVLYASRQAKYEAIVAEVVDAQGRGQPVLIGTASVEESERLAAILREVGAECAVLNASNDEAEAAIISEAGAPGAVTVSTNMAGRGTDIRLGGANEQERERVVQSGGLYVIGTNRHESRRIDNQLKGRASRQGDPGSSRFIISLEDDLMQRFGVDDLIPKKHLPECGDLPVKDAVVHKKIRVVQRIIEGQNLDIRRTLWNYSSFLEDQRRLYFSHRADMLSGSASSRLVDLCPARYEKLRARVGQTVLDRVERQISVYHFDRAWIDYLATIAAIREGIHLNRLGGREPLHEFLKQSAAAFERMERDVELQIKATFEKVKIDSSGIDAEKERLQGPSSTWTYLVNDNPFDWLGSLTSMRHAGFGAWAGILFGLFWWVAAFVALTKSVCQRFSGNKRD